ncbi:MAG: AraC family transcriptional regulator [Microthrixaceae bacterium]|nr:AraC family transcriptional regulator [Microthrixaceae bacterium]
MDRTVAAANRDPDCAGLAGTLPIAFVRDFVQLVGDELDLGETLRRAGIPAGLVADDRSRVTIEQASRVVRGIWQMTGDEILGLGHHAMQRGTFRMLAIGLVHTPDLVAALKRLCEFSSVIPAMPTVRSDEVDGQVRVWLDVEEAGLDETGLGQDLSAVLLLAVVQRFASWLVSRRVDALCVELPGKQPADSAHLDLVFGAPLQFNAAAPALRLDQALMSAPVTQDEASLEVYLAQCPAVWLSRRDFGTTLNDRVRRVLLRRSISDWPSHDELARAMAMSAPTLRRRLRDQGTSVAEMKDEIRRDMAIESLSLGEESVSDLADRLGFSEPSAFHRAFRRWTGQAPGVYRSSAVS